MNTDAMGRFEERGFDSLVCPKPRRVGVFNSSKSRWPTNCYQSEMADSDACTDLLDIILSRGGNQMASSPPYFNGSPPSRAVNPVIQDVRFNTETAPLTSPTPPYSPSSRGGGCVRVKFGLKPAAVRIEGFDCLSRDTCHCSISAVA